MKGSGYGDRSEEGRGGKHVGRWWEDKAGDGRDGQGKTRTNECIHRSGETEAICSLDRSQ